jgi:dipeptidyl aminopeptidase/acylaminoacyl peptidase
VSISVGVLAMAATGYLAAGAIVYDRVSLVDPGCDGPAVPASFKLEGLDTSPYLMPKYDEVQIVSRDPRIALSGWYVPGALGTSGPAVVVVHGLSSCKREEGVLLPAGMLHRHGFSVLLVDLRDHGESAFEDGRYAGGTEEYLDVLGAWDWLQRRGHPAERIGLLGRSMGAASVLIAAGEEPRVAAIWEDSGYANVGEAIHDELVRRKFPTLLAPAGILAARVIAGDDITSRSPLGAVAKLHRPLFITHGDADSRFSVRFAYELAEAVRASGESAEIWIVRGAGHVEGAEREPQEYERRLADFFGRTLGAG